MDRRITLVVAAKDNVAVIELTNNPVAA